MSLNKYAIKKLWYIPVTIFPWVSVSVKHFLSISTSKWKSYVKVFRIRQNYVQVA